MIYNMSMDKIFSYIIPRKEKVILGFKVFYGLILVTVFAASRSLYFGDNNALFFYNLGVNSGRAALVFYVMTLVPGIAERFGIRHKLLALLRIFRRYLGITMYLLALNHSLSVKFIITLASKQIIPLRLFEVLGFGALSILFFLFITSNDLSLGRLGIWWYRIHRLTYLSMGLIFLHVALQRFSIWSVIMGITVALQISSFAYKYFVKIQSSI